MLQGSMKSAQNLAALFSPAIFILTTEIIHGTFRPALANLQGRSYAGRIHREDTYA
jgi:hypothetical protein